TRRDGSYRIRVPAGTFKVQAAYRDLIAPTPRIVTVMSGGSVDDVNLQFCAKEALIAGRVTYKRGAHSRFRPAHSHSGRHAYTVAGLQGFYALHVNSGDTWHVQAVSEVISGTGTLTETIFLKSARIAVTTQAGPPPSQLNLALEPSSRLPDGLAFKIDTAQ